MSCNERAADDAALGDGYMTIDADGLLSASSHIRLAVDCDATLPDGSTVELPAGTNIEVPGMTEARAYSADGGVD